MGRLKICVSDRCFFPHCAFWCSQKTVKLAESLGYEAIEFHPTWAIWIESMFKNKLNCHPDKISSFHASWREDARSYWQGSWLGKIIYPAYNIFPPEPLGTKTLKILEKRYQKPVVIHWQQNFTHFQKPILELHGLLKMNKRQILNAISKKEIKGIVIDTDKFKGWLKENKDSEAQVLKDLFPHIQEVHFRFGHQENLDLFSNKVTSNSAKLTKKLIKMGYQGKVVVEMGWPDKGSIKILHQLGLKKTHQEIINCLKKYST